MIIAQILNALALGGMYALIALGYTMIYGIMRLINFAHGEVVMVGAYVAYYVMRALGLTPEMPLGILLAYMLLVIIISMIASAALGMLIEQFAYRKLRHAPKVNLLITAIGVSLLLQNLARILFGADPKTLGNYFKGGMSIAGADIFYKQIIVIVMSIIIMTLLMIFVYKTKMGKAMRAVSQDTTAATLMGINVNQVIQITFAIGSALAAVAGVMYLLTYKQITPTIGTMIGLKAFVAAVLGGIGSLPGAVLGAFLVGGAETFAKSLGFTSYADTIVFSILIIILLFKPSGILGKNVKEKV